MRLVVLVPLLLLAGPALGAEPAYVGKWAEMADAKCSEPLLITATTLEALGDDSWLIFREDEGVTILLDEEEARARGFDTSGPMSRIVLEVFSALDGVGLTAAVASALAAKGIACNVVAAFHHDNLFVPAADGARTLEILRELAASYA